MKFFFNLCIVTWNLKALLTCLVLLCVIGIRLSRQTPPWPIPCTRMTESCLWARCPRRPRTPTSRSTSASSAKLRTSTSRWTPWPVDPGILPRSEIITVRGQSYVLRLLKYWPPPPSPPGECVPPPLLRGEDTLPGGEVGGWGVNILEDAKHSSVLYLYEILFALPHIAYCLVLCSVLDPGRQFFVNLSSKPRIRIRWIRDRITAIFLILQSKKLNVKHGNYGYSDTLLSAVDTLVSSFLVGNCSFLGDSD